MVATMITTIADAAVPMRAAALDDNESGIKGKEDSVELLDEYVFTYGQLTYKVNNEQVTIVGCDEEATEISIPAKIDGLPVVSIGKNAFWFSENLVNVEIAEGVTSIEEQAFYKCSSLINIEIPKSITSIGQQAFAYCSSLISAEIPNGVDAIGEMTFAYCSSLTNIKIPESVTSIREDAFYDCSSLIVAEIANGVKSMGEHVFSGCSSLINIKIPESVTSIGEGAFSECISLTSIEISANITEIRDSTFFNCSNLINVKIPDNVTSIGIEAFTNCSSLTEIEVPEGVSEIKMDTFHGCSSLTNVKIPKSVITICELAFADCSSLRNIKIPEGVKSIERYAFERCTSLKNIEIPESVTSIAEMAFWYCSSLKSIKISKNVTSIKRNTFYYCSSLKSIEIPKSVIEIGKGVFYKCDNVTIYCESGSYAHQYAKDNNIPFVIGHISDGTSEDDNDAYDFATISYKGITYDLLHQPINIYEKSKAEVSVKVNYKKCTGNEKIYLTQGTEKSLEMENNTLKTFKPTDVFDEGKDIYILIVNTEIGKSISKRTKLKIVKKVADGEWIPDSGVEGWNFKIGKETGLTVPDSVAVFGGMEINWKLDFIPISVEYDKEDSNKINIVFGTNIEHVDNGKDKEESKFFKDFDFNKYKKDFKKAASKQGRTLKQLRNDFKMSKNYKMNLFGGNVASGGSSKKAFDVDVAGYAEAKIINGELKFIEGQLCFDAEVSVTYQGQLFIWVVPVYYEVGAGAGIGIEGDMINISPESFIPQFEAYINAKIKGSIGGGVGVAKIATVGLAGEASLNLRNALSKDYLKVWGEGSANCNVKVFGKEVAKKEFAKGDFLIYETGNSNGLISDDALKIYSLNERNLYSEIDINKVYENESRAYASASTDWYGNVSSVSLMDASIANKKTQLLAENVYTESAPVMQTVDGKKVMVMLWDNAERDAVNRTMLVYSVYDDENGSWSAPAPVYDDGTADFYPCFNDGYLVWQNEKSKLDDSMSLLDIAKLGEIYISRWNGSGFDKPVAVTDNDTLDTQPFVCASGSEVSVIWSTNTENDIIGTSGKNSILSSKFDGSACTKPIVLKEGLNTITGISAGYTDSGLNIAYVEDADNDMQTITDRDITIVAGGEAYKLTDNEVLDSNPVFEGNTVYYYSDGNIAYTDLTDKSTNTVFKESKTGLTDNFTVSVNKKGERAIWWNKNVDSATEVFAALYRDGEWSDEIQLSETGNQSKYPTGVLENDGSMYIAYNNGIWEDGANTQNDLYIMNIDPAYDLAVSDAYIDEDSMTVYATVKNTGELNVDSYTVALNDNGTVNSQKTITEGLKAGESADIEIGYVKPDDLDKRTITLSVAIDGKEYDLTNNNAELSVGNCDVEVADVKNYENLPASSAVAVIKNNGYSDTGKVTVCLRKESANGDVEKTQTIDNLPAGESTEITFNYDIVENSNIKWYVTAEAENDEISLGNNDMYFINDYRSSVSDYSGEILRYSIDNNILSINACVENNTDEDLSAAAIIAVYDSAGRLKAVSRDDVDVSAYKNSSIDVTIDNYTYKTDDEIKLFLCDDQNSLRPVCELRYSKVS